MLSIEKCRNRLKPSDFTNEQVGQIRDNLYQLADLFISEYLRTKKVVKNDITKTN